MKKIRIRPQCIAGILLCIVYLSFSQTPNLDSLKTAYDGSLNAETALLLLKEAVSSDHEMAEEYFNKIQTDFLSDDQHYQYEKLRGSLYTNLLKYDSAVQVYTDLLTRLEGTKKASLMADINDQIGSIYIQLRENDQAFSYFNEAIEIRIKNGLTAELPKSYYAFGNHQFRLSKINEAIISYKKGVSTIEGENQISLLANLYYMLGNAYNVPSTVDSAMYFLQSAKSLYDQVGGDRIRVAVSNELAKILILKTQYSEARPILEKNLSIIRSFNDWQYYNRTYGLLVAANEGTNDYKEALFYMKHKYDTMLKFLVSQRTESVAQITEDLRTTKGLDAAEEQAVQAEEQAFFATRKARIFGWVAIVLIIILIITYLLFTRAIQKKQLENLQAMVIGEENERKRVAKDLHDGIGVLLTSVKLRLSNFQDKVESKKEFQSSLDQIDNACTEVRRISHNMVPASLTKLGLQEAILDLLDNVSASTDIVIEEALDYKEGAYDESKEVLIYRVVQELINNSLKYADAHKLSVSISKSKQDYLLTYSDDGKGFDKSKIKFGLGLRSIASRVNILKGKLSYESAPGEGAIFNITIPHYG